MSHHIFSAVRPEQQPRLHVERVLRGRTANCISASVLSKLESTLDTNGNVQ